MKNKFIENIGVWILVGLLIFSIYSHYKTGEDLENICIKVQALNEGYLDIESHEKFMSNGIELDSIAITMKKHNDLMNSNSSEAKAYKWFRSNANEIKQICDKRIDE
ncbi:hypothetical protein M947_10450 [Sulfurimonas hongkongensis]|uniref:Uncharacterized protein n=1 Tax=Sulfurimonas hongkongensis TaxID=1172190 RepID=T0JA32_9BACT|nr:hypothetical protein [Sulfurimonas hongkongensis]EQB34876.1 hypothetical protein M947_10450 [Sulfurimonas hongkongensis]